MHSFPSRKSLAMLAGLALLCAVRSAMAVEPDGRAAKPARLLVVTVTNGFRHSYI